MDTNRTKKDETYDIENPPQSLMHPRAHSFALPWFIGALASIIVLAGVVYLFWAAAHPRSARLNEDRAIGTSGFYSSEGGHDPVRPLGNTKNELKFRGDTTQPIATPQTSELRR